MFEVIISYCDKDREVIVTDDPEQFLIEGDNKNNVLTVAIKKIRKEK